MKKTISLFLSLVFLLTLIGLGPVLAEEENATSEQTASDNASAEEESVTTTQEASEAETVTENVTVTSEAVQEVAPVTTKPAASEVEGLEKIPSPAQINLFERIKKMGNDLYGVRKANTVKNNTNSATTEGLEKIPSPAQINLFNQIKKIGTDLYGVRKASSTIANIQKNANSLKEEMAKKAEEAKKSGLTKIVSPDQMKLFEKITKIGTDLFGIRKKGSNLIPAMSSDVKTCVSAAIDKKDGQLSKEIQDNATNMLKLISERGDCHKAALSLSAEREAAVSACNNKFQEGIKNMNKNRQEVQKKTWNAYNTEIKACGKTTNSEIHLEDGGEILN